MADTSPAFQWYPKDAISSVRLSMMSLAEEGAYRRALDFCWLNGSLPSDPNKLIRLIGKGCSLKIVKAIIPMFIEKDGQLYHERLDLERNKQKAFRDKQAENGKRGGRPPKETQQKGLGYFGETQTETKETSPICNLQSPISIKEKETKVSKNPPIPLDIEPELLERYLKFQTWAKENAPRVLKMKEPLTAKQLQSLLEVSDAVSVKTIFEEMHNWADLTKRMSAYKTAKTWLERRKTNPIGKQPEPQKSTYDRKWKGYDK